ncbi:MAG: hypothetical protein HC822_15915 [Oscillochloris sp.]|nr:hypothetical protein [Oscillochloris sp.]
MPQAAAAEADFRGSDHVELIAAGGRILGRLSLKGSARAIDYVRTCGLIAGGRVGDGDARNDDDMAGAYE